jgi:agmatine deiminase
MPTNANHSRKSPVAATPAALGYRMPAEWERQEAVWLSWPHKRKTWPKQFRPIPYAFARIVAAISRFENVRINAADVLQPRAKLLCERAGAVMTRVRFYDHPTDDTWCRDHGPIFVKHAATGEVALTDWAFNAWGGKHLPCDRDNDIPVAIARRLRARRFVNPMVLEGGSLDVNGEGLLITTEQCLLNPNRNPTLNIEQIEQNLRDYLGVDTVLWLGRGLVGDDTDGHVDDLTRFFRNDGIVTAVETNRRDANFAALDDNRRRLAKMRTPAGRQFDIVELPMPKPVAFQGIRVPASYANFLVVNGAVMVPTFRQSRSDDRACEILAGCFLGREIVPIDCYHLIWGRGSLHCVSQQQPAGS